ncbi:tRNA uridine-5-carboxymethylaminomethyl(34) synthesis GTPase MnmE [Hydromonas duriensis]|uniref:tRNA modification GTPase MnmE n=1 Tax=Hydromonas duriensis TaxID=1527608 RepID=A0A4R6YAI7_9BURK|nr:tRNA uridine-5-carboxymethylaminomethyl(34) synthesis GTPase MnmE [Hydromonas duriensis]TDR32542.1 tRNA modification GTPase trmE [Hydromonas duriensis]
MPNHPTSPPIVAIATATGRGGVGVVRASGSFAAIDALAQAICGRTLTPRHAHYGAFLDEHHQPIDHGLALYFNAPHSYTGEHVLELQGHGGPVVMQLLLRRCLSVGAAHGMRLAAAGEFTERAFLNDKIDLAQAEAIADLIEASTEAAAKSAVRSLSGEFSSRIHTLVDKVVHLRMLVEATLDFPEEEIDFLQKADAFGQLDRIQAELAGVLSTAKQGALLRDGVNVVLVGQPNVGKSSLLNALSGQDVAIVTPIAGTTRDTVTQSVQIDGVPLNIIDTAGLRDTDDVVEKIGIERTWAAVEKADVVLHLIDATQAEQERLGDTSLLKALDEKIPSGAPRLTLINKSDLLEQSAVNDDSRMYISAKTGEGLDPLRARLLFIVGFEKTASDVFIARERHLTALRHADEHIQTAYAHALTQDQKLDLFAEELRLAQEQLNQITGAFTSDDLLGVIFSSFCIGK